MACPFAHSPLSVACGPGGGAEAVTEVTEVSDEYRAVQRREVCAGAEEHRSP